MREPRVQAQPVRGGALLAQEQAARGQALGKDGADTQRTGALAQQELRARHGAQGGRAAPTRQHQRPAQHHIAPQAHTAREQAHRARDTQVPRAQHVGAQHEEQVRPAQERTPRLEAAEDQRAQRRAQGARTQAARAHAHHASHAPHCAAHRRRAGASQAAERGQGQRGCAQGRRQCCRCGCGCGHRSRSGHCQPEQVGAARVVAQLRLVLVQGVRQQAGVAHASTQRVPQDDGRTPVGRPRPPHAHQLQAVRQPLARQDIRAEDQLLSLLQQEQRQREEATRALRRLLRDDTVARYLYTPSQNRYIVMCG